MSADKRSERSETRKDILAVGVAVVLFVAIALYQLDLPGLYTDEAFDVVPSMQLLLGHPVELQRNAGLHVLGLDLPLMSSSDYQGVTSTYLVLPFFALFGISVFSVRLMTVLVGVLALVITFYLAKRWFGRTTARLALLLLAVSPSWIFWSRLGVYVVSEVVPIGAGALLAFTVWARRRPLGARNGPLFVGAFLLGLGLATKLLFLWLITALAGCALILFGRTLWDHRGTWFSQWLRWARIALAFGGAFCLGALPFLLYNAMTRGTLYVLRANAASTTHGVNNTAILRNLWTEADAFRVLLDGSYFWFQGRLGHVYYNALAPSVFAVAALGLLAATLAGRGKGSALPLRALRFPIAALTVAIAIAGLLALGKFESTPAHLALALSAGLGCVSVLWLTLAAVRDERAVPVAGWALLIVGSMAGTIWWFAGAGRPEGPDPVGPLGLWPVDAAGVLFWACGAALALALGLDRKPVAHQRAIAASLAILGLVVAQSAVTLSGLWATHLLLVLPLPQVIIAASLVTGGKLLLDKLHRMGQSRLAFQARVVPVILVIMTLIGLDLLVDYSYQRDLAATGGGSTFSDAIYSLADYLDEQPLMPQVVAMDWGFKRPLQLLTQERVNPLEAYGYSADPTPEFYIGLRGLLEAPGRFYLFHTPDGTAYKRFDAFMQEVASAGKQARLVKTFYHRDGVPVYLVYTVN